MADKRSIPILGDQTAVVQFVAGRALSGRRRRPAKKRTKKKATRTRARARRAPAKKRTKKKAARFVKGSPAAKRHMAKLRAMQKKKRRRR
jgi:topoisomerase IA-like protein